jgi:multidrug transporter EmrE-like cation transporter
MRSAPVAPEKIVEILGNHDLWWFLRFPYDQYLLHPITSFVASTREIEGIRFVQFVPIRFPTGVGRYLCFAVLWPEALDALERELESPTNASVTIVGCHWTSSYMVGVESVRSSKSRRTLGEILRDYGVTAFLNGHEHPATDYEVVHLGGTIELTATDFKQRDGFNVLALDNGRLSYVRMVSTNGSKAMVTSPMRNELATHIFPDGDFQIRVLSFSENATRFHVSGDVVGDLQFQRKTASGASLYAMDVHLQKGQYSIKISGDLDDDIRFAAGTEVASFAEFQTLDFCLVSYRPLARVAAIYLGLVVLGIVYLPQSLETGFERSYAYMNGDAGAGSILGNVMPPLFIGFLLRRFPAFTRKIVLLLVVYPLVLPYAITRIETAICLQFVWGCFCDGHFNFDPVGSFMCYAYYTGIGCGFVSLFALLSFNGRFKRAMEGCFALLLILAGIRAWHKYGLDLSPTSRLFHISPAFHLIPMIAAAGFLVLFSQSRQARRNSWSSPSFVPWGNMPSESIL